MTKVELLDYIRENTNAAELATLGVNTNSSKDELQNAYDSLMSLRVHKTKPDESPLDPAHVDDVPNEDNKPDEGEKPDEDEKPDDVEEKPKDEFDDLLGRIKGAQAPPTPGAKKEKPFAERKKTRQKRGASSPDSFRIQGYVLLLATDTVFPTLLSVANNYFDRKHPKISVTDLQLAEKDFNKLEPLADQAADYLSFNVNPVAGFFLVSTFMYANNLISLKMDINKKI